MADCRVQTPRRRAANFKSCKHRGPVKTERSPPPRSDPPPPPAAAPHHLLRPHSPSQVNPPKFQIRRNFKSFSFPPLHGRVSPSPFPTAPPQNRPLDRRRNCSLRQCRAPSLLTPPCPVHSSRPAPLRKVPAARLCSTIWLICLGLVLTFSSDFFRQRKWRR